MNYLGINCTVEGGRGRIMVIIVDKDKNIIRHVFKSPSVFSFKNNSAEILNWHRDNIISLISQYDIDGVVVKKNERDSIQRRPKNSDIFKLYMEGTMLSLAGSIGKYNKHFYKMDIMSILQNSKIFDKGISEITTQFELAPIEEKIPNGEIAPTKDTLLSVLALNKIIK